MDVLVTCPKGRWDEWLCEGDLPGDEWSGYESHMNFGGGPKPQIEPGERVYVVAHGRLRGYAPLVRLEDGQVWDEGHRVPYGFSLVRRGGAVACTIPRPIRGFQGWRYRDWEREEETPFPTWQDEGVQ